VSILSGNGSADTLTKVAAGSADIGLVGVESVLAMQAAAPTPVKAVFGLYCKKPDDIEVPEGSPIASIADLKGKTVATSSFSSSNVVWPLIAEKNGLAPDDVKLLKVDSAALAPMLASGQADAIINWVTVSPLDAAVMKEAGKGLTIIPWSKFGYEGYGQALVASDKFIAERPEVLKALLRAYVKAAGIAIKDPAAAGAAVHDAVAEVDADVAAQEFAASVPLIKNEISDKYGLGSFEPELLKTTWEWVAKSQSLDVTALDPQTVVDTSFLPKSLGE
jgi:NitT/TauT family transport system substrate-binding protein